MAHFLCTCILTTALKMVANFINLEIVQYSPTTITAALPKLEWAALVTFLYATGAQNMKNVFSSSVTVAISVSLNWQRKSLLHYEQMYVIVILRRL